MAGRPSDKPRAQPQRTPLTNHQRVKERIDRYPLAAFDSDYGGWLPNNSIFARRPGPIGQQMLVRWQAKRRGDDETAGAISQTLTKKGIGIYERPDGSYWVIEE